MNNNMILNLEQKKAIQYNAGPLLIVAGAGTGKTTVITERIYWLVKEGFAKTDEILALTFTEKACHEMEQRVDQKMPYGYLPLWIQTFHSFCERILKDEGLHIGLNPSFKLLTETDSTKFIKDRLYQFELDYFRPRTNPTKFITNMLVHFARLNDEDIQPEIYLQWAKRQEAGENNKQYLELARAYQLYEKLKAKEGIMDFSDLIGNTLKLFRTRTNILKNYQQKFKYVLVDEFQDTNIAQYEIIKLLAPNGGLSQLTVVGDDNQSIYKFRGAAISNILLFKKDYPKVQMIVLNKNYRSNQAILDAAYKLIKNNDPDTLEVRLGISKKLISERHIKGNKVHFIYNNTVEDEAEKVASEIKRLIKTENYSYKDFAILVRANNHSEPFQKNLARQGIPFQFLGPGLLFKQKEVKELIAYLRLLNNPDDSQSLYLLLASNYFNIPGRDLVVLSNYARRLNVSLFRACDSLHTNNLHNINSTRPVYLPYISPKLKDRLKEIISMINRHLDLVPHQTAGQIIYYFLKDTGWIEKFSKPQAADERLIQNIAKFLNKLKDFEVTHENNKVPEVVDWIELAQELGESPLAQQVDWSDNDAVSILTVHSSKGLEFPCVFMVNLTSQRFPTRERKEKIPIPQELIKEELPQGDFHTQEERRLFYVGATRARDVLVLTAANFYTDAKRANKVSPFVYEMLGADIPVKLFTKEISDQLPLFFWEKEDTPPEVSSRTKIEYLSYSLIQTFKMCPLHYKLRYQLKIPTPQTPATSFGISIHGALKDFYTQIKSGVGPNEELILNSLKANWQIEGYQTKDNENDNYKIAQKYLLNFLNTGFNKNLLPAALEVPFKFPLANNIKFGGKIDRVDTLPNGEIEIIDYKTSQTIPSQKDVDQDMQMTLYALAANEIKDSLFWKDPDKVKLSLYFLHNQEKLTTTRTKEQLETMKKELAEIVSEIESSDFHCSKNIFCRNCEYKLFCEN